MITIISIYIRTLYFLLLILFLSYLVLLVSFIFVTFFGVCTGRHIQTRLINTVFAGDHWRGGRWDIWRIGGWRGWAEEGLRSGRRWRCGWRRRQGFGRSSWRRDLGHIRRVSREVEVVVPVFMRGAWRWSTSSHRRRRRRLLGESKLCIDQAGAQAQV